MAKLINTSGKRKSSIARASLTEGKGEVRVNGIMLDVFQPEMARLKIREPLMLAKDIADKVDIDIIINGGGIMSGADAARLAVARALVEFSGRGPLREKFIKYDRTLLVQDVRFKETCKPNDSKARAKRQKSYR
ncbi:30S ribosomal protein S9 [Candidatus Woesearchaeota archaeon CG10_big_fil_rev_8_21_14_0_10_44_13]|nr:MAG: 30S ribosomal protein S9 [Candidatus Woesearchaeota archaeon CG10_big_fil_rev_8_21_14_0_10_44_13]